MTTEDKISIGSWNESGLINDLDKRGFSDFNCISEILANSIEDKVCATTIKFIIENEYIYITDDGNGMNLDNITNMWDIFRANNNDYKSLGISGLGAKAATKILSRNNEIIYYTFNNSKWRKIIVPWDIINRNKIYTDQVSVDSIDEDDEYELNNLEIFKGTTLKIPYNEDIHILIKNNFTEDRKSLLYHERFDVIFGRFNKKIELIDNIEVDNNSFITPYNYFSETDLNFYKGINREKINIIYHNNKYRYIWFKNEDNDEYYEIVSSGRGLSKKSSKVKYSNEWDIVGEIYVNTGLRKSYKIINEETSQCYHGEGIGEYDEQYFNTCGRLDIVKNDLAKIPLIRNNQVIGSIVLENFKSSSSRANKDSLLKIIQLRTEIKYETFSNQDNVLDKIFGIQSNKNQLNTDEIPKKILRLIDEIKENKWKEIHKYFKHIIEKNTPKPAPAPAPVPVPVPASKSEPKPEPKSASKSAAQPEPKPEPKSASKSEPKPEPKSASKSAAQPEPKPEPKSASKSAAQPEPKPEPKPEPESKAKPEPKPEPESKAKPAPKPEPKPEPESKAKPAPEKLNGKYLKNKFNEIIKDNNLYTNEGDIIETLITALKNIN